MSWGNKIRLSIFGGSHGPAIGAVLEGLPAGEPVDSAGVAAQLARRHAAAGRRRAAGPERPAERPDNRRAAVRGD